VRGIAICDESTPSQAGKASSGVWENHWIVPDHPEAVKHFNGRNALPRVCDGKPNKDAQHRVPAELGLFIRLNLFTAPVSPLVKREPRIPLGPKATPTLLSELRGKSWLAAARSFPAAFELLLYKPGASPNNPHIFLETAFDCLRTLRRIRHSQSHERDPLLLRTSLVELRGEMPSFARAQRES
jgi:hypothetical protein